MQAYKHHTTLSDNPPSAGYFLLSNHIQIQSVSLSGDKPHFCDGIS
ncbi:hypothetical protein L910_4812 [Vibrio fluvialis PG41]|uniref:Uncharacterized protein n=1 Tax=Vibrio fluvialis PG41 TaxID=1336752 RepID=S7JK92_VIBFL|nr:hypothetical protein L910_4812 [Vibrio fluvialis PG41]